jgi:cytidylate kinase
MIVAIDGPAGAGKSTVARRLADRLGFRYLDTGAMYRALTWLALERGVPLDDAERLAELAETAPVAFEGARVFIFGSDVTDAIREPRIDRAVPGVARHGAVRRVMRVRQRELADEGDAVIEGRDIGTVVVPDAAVKVYLVAETGEPAATGRPAGDRGRRARHGSPPARRERRRPDAARRRRGADRHHPPRRRGRRGAHRGAHPSDGGEPAAAVSRDDDARAGSRAP